MKYLKTTLWINFINYFFFSAESQATKPIDDFLQDIFEEENCRENNMPSNCDISNNCTHVTCLSNISASQAAVSIIIQRCRDPVAITTVVKSTDADLDWTQQGVTNSSVAVPGFHYNYFSVTYGVFLNSVVSADDNKSIRLKLWFHYGTKMPMSITETLIIDHVVPLSTKGCSFLVWWYSQSSYARLSIVVAIAIVILVFLSCCCLCCFCRPYRKRIKSAKVKRRQSQHTVSFKAYYQSRRPSVIANWHDFPL